MTAFLIIANGPFVARDIIIEAAKGKKIIALDGASVKLNKLNIKPDIILGDFDSMHHSEREALGIEKLFHDLQENDLPYQTKDNITIVPAKNQLLTDLMKALDYADQQHATEITLICATGGRMDHHEGAMRILRSHYKTNRPIILLTEQHGIRFVKNEDIKIEGIPGDKCGILAYPKAVMSSTGLEFEAIDLALEFGLSENICNSLIAETATIHIEGEALVIMPPLLLAQREWMKKTLKEQYEVLLREADV